LSKKSVFGRFYGIPGHQNREKWKMTILSKNTPNVLFCVQWWALECTKKGSGANIFVFLGSGSLSVAYPPGVCYY
jgi:hypothetical protein